MKAWREGDASRPGPAGAEPGGAPDAETLEELRERGIDLDPGGSAAPHRHDDAQPEHSHPHRHAEPGAPPAVGIIGAGAVGTALGAALHRAGWPVVAVGSRDEA
jgi:hypothetical protein